MNQLKNEIMKRLFFSLLILCAAQLSYAQIPVTDVTLNTQQVYNQAVNGLTWSQQLAQMIQQGAILSTTLKYVQEVSSAVRDISYTKDLIERQGYIVKSCERLMKSDRALDAATARSLSNSVSSFLLTNNSLITLINSTLTSRLKMNDGERFQVLTTVKTGQQRILQDLNKVDLILSTSQSTKEIMELRLFK